MHFAPTEEQSAIQEMALDFAKEQLAPRALEWDEQSHFPVDVIRQTAELGMASIYVPEEHGGSGLSRLDGAMIFEALSYGCPTIASYISIQTWWPGWCRNTPLTCNAPNGCRSLPAWNGSRATA